MSEAGDLARRVAAEQVRQAGLHRRTEGAALAALVCMTMLVAWPSPVVLSWAVPTALLGLVRGALPPRRGPLVVSTAALALSWGMGYALMAGDLPSTGGTFLIVSLAGLAAGWMLLLSPLPAAGAAWLLPLFAPPIARHVALGTRGDYELALLLTVFVLTLLFALRRLSTSRLATILSEIEHADLTEALSQAVEQRREAEEGLRGLISHATDILTVISPDGRALFASPAVEALLHGAERPLELVHPEDRGALLAAQSELLSGRAVEQPHTGWRMRRPDGSWQDVEGSMSLMTEGPYRGSVLVVGRDVSRRNEIARELARRADLLRALVHAAPDPIFYKDAEGMYLGCNDAYADVIGRSADEIVGLTDADLHPADVARRSTERDALALSTGTTQRDEYWMERADGTRVLLDTVKSVFRDERGEPAGVVGICRDITEIKRLEDELRSAATTDALTGLMNRRRLNEVLDEEWNRARRHAEPLSVIMADVDHFKAYNDALGHVEGDACLSEVADALRQCALRPGDVVARYGGEEFTLILPHTGPAGAMAVATNIQAALRHVARPHPRSDASHLVTLSLGVATAHPRRDREQDVKALIDAADRALYRAKEAGRNTVRAEELT